MITLSRQLGDLILLDIDTIGTAFKNVVLLTLSRPS